MHDTGAIGGRILYVALADARGHLMRAHLLRAMLAPVGVDVDIVTTSGEGRQFLDVLGSPSEVLSQRFRVEVDAAHNVRRGATDARVLRYVFDPRGAVRDLAWLSARARGAVFVVSDSFHPGLMFAPPGMRLVHVYGENMWNAVAGNLDGRAPAVARGYRWLIHRLKARAFGHVEHVLSARGAAWRGNHVRLPPIIPLPGAVARRAARSAVVYLNPHFRDPAIASAIEAALARGGYDVHAVGEGYANRPGWRGCDPALADRVAAADVLISGAGMGALGMARAFGVPLLALSSAQPEQRANLASLPAGISVRAVPARASAGELAAALASLPPRVAAFDPRARAEAIHDLWTDVFVRLVARARTLGAATPDSKELECRPPLSSSKPTISAAATPMRTASPPAFADSSTTSAIRRAG